MNFISTSISYKKREIGILRAVGARSSDVFGIFFNEALIIALINFALAIVGVFIGATALNGFLRNEYGLLVTLLSFGIRQISLVLGVSVFVAFLSSLLPVSLIAKKRPIDAINNR
jgi:ABC-type antimicrobial peptide transport system permease subunit